jgi:hypothetical protein
MSEVVPYCFVPTNLKELMEFSKMAASSSFVSEAMRGKLGDVLMCIQMGAEIGLNPLQSLQNIAVIKNRPCVWGDAALGVVIVCPAYEYHKEYWTGSIETDDRTAHCTVKRKGSAEHTVAFSMKDAKQACLWKKNQVWTQYPDRMLQMRARAFALRDQFADALKGLSVREEVEDYNEPVKRESTMTIEAKVIEAPKTDEEIMSKILPEDINKLADEIMASKDKDQLRSVYARAYVLHGCREDLMPKLKDLKDMRKKQLESFGTAMEKALFDDDVPNFTAGASA